MVLTGVGVSEVWFLVENLVLSGGKILLDDV